MPPKKSPADRVRDILDKKLPGAKARKGSEGAICDVVQVLPTGLPVVDYHILGCGGLPMGRIGEVFSDEGAGKTSLGFQFLAAAQQAGGMSVLIETEDTLQIARAPVFGVDLDELLLLHPETMDGVLESIELVAESVPKGCGPNVLVWDSLAATELLKQQPGKRANQMSQALPKLGRLAREHNMAVVIINQLREKIGVLFGDNTTTPGGRGLKHHASWRFQMWRGAAFKAGPDAIGIHTTVKCVKSKVGLPFRKAKLRLRFEDGWDNNWSLMNLGKDRNILTDSAASSKANIEKVLQAIGAPTD